jgi:hypothetical protein
MLGHLGTAGLSHMDIPVVLSEAKDPAGASIARDGAEERPP